MKTAPYLRPGSTGFYNDRNEWQCTGSMMGRANVIPSDWPSVRKLHLRRVPLVDGCYDQGGAYWGGPDDLFCAWGDSDMEQAVFYTRAKDRKEAKSRARMRFPNAKFYR